MIDAELERQARELIGESCLALDAERFDVWLAPFDTTLRYTIVAASPEIRREMTWLDLDRASLEHLCQTMPTHARDPGQLTRHPSVLILGIGAAST